MSGDNGLLRPDQAMGRLSTNDMKRLSAAAGRPAKEVLADEEEMFAGLIFCLRSREDPAYTFEAACDVPWGEVFDLTPDLPPPIPPPATSGASRGSSGGPSSTRKPTASGTAPS